MTPGSELIHGWHGVNLSSPFAELAVAVNLTWLSWVLYEDAIAAPAGSTAVSEAAFRRFAPEHAASWIKGVRYLAPASFVIATLILYWATWLELRIALPVLLVGAAVYGYQQVRRGVDRHDVRVGLWLVGYLAALLVMSAVGSFGGAGLIAAPWDSVVVAAIGAAGFHWRVREAGRHLAGNPAPAPETDRAAPAVPG